MKGRNVREEVMGGMDRDERKKCEGRSEGRDEYGWMEEMWGKKRGEGWIWDENEGPGHHVAKMHVSAN